ncbi:hypothetical protein BJY04DRAFT_221558 [Aspergillus karnatakaensis]|uniref:hydrophobin family protein n=1 Tax=Aspergillus karnatakaensis TaxID=1810916 RepID=UPI003CCDA442
MKFLTVAALFAAAAVAMPYAPGSPLTGTTPSSAGTCGNAQLSCCDTLDQNAVVTEDESASLLDLLKGADLDVLSDGVLGKYSGCSALASVEVIEGTVGGQCNNHAACCNGGDGDINGLVNVAVPCLPINVL